MKNRRVPRDSPVLLYGFTFSRKNHKQRNWAKIAAASQGRDGLINTHLAAMKDH